MSTLRPPLWLQLARGRSLIPLLLLCIPLSSKAKSPNAKPAGSTAVQSSAMEPFHVIEDIVYLQPGRDEKMDLYLPARGPGDSPAPAVIWVHGNGSNKASGRIRDECLTFTSAGYICASIDWTLDTPFRVLPILDCKNAVRFLRVHAKEYHIDPSRIAIGGGSGGGYLASMVGFTAGEVGFEPPEPYPGVSSAVGAVIDFYGGYDGRRFPLVQRQLAVLPLDMAGVRPALTQIDLFQPVNHLASSVPPVLIVQGREDPLIDYPKPTQRAQKQLNKMIFVLDIAISKRDFANHSGCRKNQSIESKIDNGAPEAEHTRIYKREARSIRALKGGFSNTLIQWNSRFLRGKFAPYA